jgi:hypothetical protein
MKDKLNFKFQTCLPQAGLPAGRQVPNWPLIWKLKSEILNLKSETAGKWKD